MTSVWIDRRQGRGGGASHRGRGAPRRDLPEHGRRSPTTPCPPDGVAGACRALGAVGGRARLSGRGPERDAGRRRHRPLLRLLQRSDARAARGARRASRTSPGRFPRWRTRWAGRAVASHRSWAASAACAGGSSRGGGRTTSWRREWLRPGAGRSGRMRLRPVPSAPPSSTMTKLRSLPAQESAHAGELLGARVARRPGLQDAVAVEARDHVHVVVEDRLPGSGAVGLHDRDAVACRARR